jgi:hypothetical protein
MAKRYTDTDKWKDEWFSELSNDYKVVWQYLLDICDHAGIYKRNIKLLNYNCNTQLSEEDILNVFGSRLTKVSDDKWLINKFCPFQYGENFLNNKPNKAIESAINILNNLDLIKENDKGLLTLSIPLSKGYLTDKDQDQVKDKYKEQDQCKDKRKDQNIDKSKGNIKNIVDKAFEVLIDYDSEPKALYSAKGVIEDVGGFDAAAIIMEWDEDVKQNWYQRVSVNL